MEDNGKFTPWQVFGVALMIVTMIALAIVWNDITTKWSHEHLEWMRDHPEQVNEWLRSNGGL